MGLRVSTHHGGVFAGEPHWWRICYKPYSVSPVAPAVITPFQCQRLVGPASCRVFGDLRYHILTYIILDDLTIFKWLWRLAIPLRPEPSLGVGFLNRRIRSYSANIRRPTFHFERPR